MIDNRISSYMFIATVIVACFYMSYLQHALLIAVPLFVLGMMVGAEVNHLFTTVYKEHLNKKEQKG